MEPRATNKRPLLAKLIFNPSAGATRGSPIEMVDVIHEMQACKIVPEAYLVEPGCDLPAVVGDALAKGIRMFVVCGGDGTIDVVAGVLAGTRATLGIIPIGTQNNTALSLGIPSDIPAAVAILRNGRRVRVDMGMAACGDSSTPFLEFCSVGLVSTLFPSADDIQHGNLGRIGDFLTALAASAPAEMHLVLDNKQEVHALCHVVLVTNMPYIGPHYQLGSAISYGDGLLDVLLFADLSKMDLVGYAVQGLTVGGTEDPRIQHYHVHQVDIMTKPAMPIMADGTALGEGPVRITVRRHALTVMVNNPAEEAQPGPGPAP
jgi:diacylglycerol kinase family enzyme